VCRYVEAFVQKLQNMWLTKAWNHWFNLFVQLRKIKTTLGRIMHRQTAAVGLCTLNQVDP
jgi:hypothetical protein